MNESEILSEICSLVERLTGKKNGGSVFLTVTDLLFYPDNKTGETVSSIIFGG